MKHKANSRKGQVHAEFDAKGEAAATSLGEKLGLSKGTVRSWTRTWTNEKKAPTAKEPTTAVHRGIVEPKGKTKVDKARAKAQLEDTIATVAGDAVPRPAKLERKPLEKGQRVCWHSGDNRSRGLVMEGGEQASLVRWDNGNKHMVANQWVRPLTDEEKAEEEKVEAGGVSK